MIKTLAYLFRDAAESPLKLIWRDLQWRGQTDSRCELPSMRILELSWDSLNSKLTTAYPNLGVDADTKSYFYKHPLISIKGRKVLR